MKTFEEYYAEAIHEINDFLGTPDEPIAEIDALDELISRRTGSPIMAIATAAIPEYVPVNLTDLTAAYRRSCVIYGVVPDV